jgi:hypothetical protein
MPALKFEPEDPVEERTVMLEADVKHIRSDVSELKVDGRRLNDKVDGLSQQLVGKIDEADHRLGGKIDEVDQRLNAKIDGVEQRLSGKIDEVDRRLCGKIDSVKDSVASLALAMEKSFAELKIGRALDRVWWLLMSAALLGIMARAFKWI